MTAPTTTADAAILNALDFDALLPCDHRQHPTHHDGDQPAVWAVISLCPRCQHVGKVHLCEPGRAFMEAAANVGCVNRRCGATGAWVEFRLRIWWIGGAG